MTPVLRWRPLVTCGVLLIGLGAGDVAAATPPTLSPEERGYLAAHGPVRFAPDPAFPPFEFIDATGVAAGITPDLVALFARKLDIPITTVRFASWSEVLDGVRQRRVDALGTLTRTPEREEFLLFSRPYLSVPTVMFVRRDERAIRGLADCRGRRVGVVAGYGAHAWLSHNHPELDLALVQDPQAGLQELAARRVDALVEAMPVALYLIRARSLVNLRMLPDALFYSPQHLAVRRGDPMLLGILQKGLDSLTEQERAAIFVRWTGVDLAGRPRWLSPLVWNVLAALAVVALVAFAWVISLRRVLEVRTRALAAQDANYRRLFERNLAGVYRSTLDGRLLDCNDAFARLYGFGFREEALQHAVVELHRGPEAREAFLTALQRTGTLVNFESRGRRQDGSELWLLENSSLAPDDDGRLTQIEGTLFDITERKVMEEQLRHAQKMEAVGVLAGGVAHDFNNLLQAMLATVSLAKGDRGVPAGAAARIAELEEQIKRGAGLTRQLLLFSRRETTRPETLDLNELVRKAVGMLRRMVRENIELALHLDPNPLPVETDRGQLEQVLANLVVNAGDAMPGGGRIDLATWERDGFVHLGVRDTGHGIPEAIRERIFDPFFTTKSPGKGTGLGLSVVHGIVTRYGGTVTVTSREGAGTAFDVSLPRNAALHEEAAAPEAPEPCRGRGERVLVVEDEATARDLLAEILDSLGYSVATAASGEAALALPEAEPFDLLLTDLVLPGRSGGDVAIELALRWPRMRVVFMSGYNEDEALRMAAVGGFVRYLQKPFDMPTLARELRSALDDIC